MQNKGLARGTDDDSVLASDPCSRWHTVYFIHLNALIATGFAKEKNVVRQISISRNIRRALKSKYRDEQSS